MPDVRWRGLEHQTLYDWINTGPGPSASTPQLDYWGGLKQSLTDISSKLNSSLGELGASWEGVAGSSATTGLTPLQMWAEEAQSSADVMSSSAQDQADHVATARAAMPEPQKMPTGAPAMWQQQEAAEAAKHGNKGPAHAVAQQAADHEAKETAAADAHERAIQVMSNYQANSENNAATLGVFGAPPDIVVAVEMPNGQDLGSVGAAGVAPTAHGAAAGGPQGPTAPDMGVNPAAAHPQFGGGQAPAPASAPAASGGPGVSPAAGIGAAAAGGLGGAGAVAGFARPTPLAGGATMGTSAGARGGKDEQTRQQNARPAQGTAPSTNQPAREPGTMPPPPMGGGGAGAGAGAGTGETVRGGNPYLNVTPNSGGVVGDGGLRRPAGGANTGAMGFGGDFGPSQGGASGAGPVQHQQGGPMGPGGPLGPGAPPPAAPGGGAAGGAGQDEHYEGSSYLVEADGVFDDGRMVAPPVLGGEDDR